MQGSGKNAFGWTDPNWHDHHIKHICRRLDHLQTNRTHHHNMSPKRTFTSTPFVRNDSNTLTAKYALKRKKIEQKSRKTYKPDLYSKPNLTSGKNGFNIKGHGSKVRLQSKIPRKKRRPKTASGGITSSIRKMKKKTGKLSGEKAAKHVRSTYTRFVRMLAEHYAEEEHEGILQRVKDEAALLQRQMILKDYADGYEQERNEDDAK